MRNSISTLLVVFMLVGAALSELENARASRQIDLTTQLARHTVTVVVENKGSSAVSTYDISLRDDQATHLSFMKVTDESGASLKYTSKTTGSTRPSSFQVTLNKPIEAGASVTLTINSVFTHMLKPFPTHISQTERQLVRYIGNHFFYTPYKTKTQKTTIKMASNTVEDYTEKSPNSLVGSTLTYGSYEDIAPLSYSEMRVHFENNSPFITVSKLERHIEISHWGNLAIEEYFDVRHDGAALKGSFSRFDFQRNPSASPSAVLRLVEVLPSSASDVYYRDDIGNISTSTFVSSAKGLEFHITPRFPLFGGWKNSFYIGYNVPLDAYLNTASYDSSLFVLNTTFGVDIAEVFIEKLVVKIILPEGAKDAKLAIPFAVDAQSTAKHYTYLDTTGRTVLVIEKSNVVKDHNQYFQVNYHYSRLSMLHEPLLVAGAFFAFFIAVMIYVRFEINIRPNVKPVVDLKHTAAVEQFNQSIAAFDKEYKKLQNAYKTIGDQAVYKTERSRTVSLYVTKPLQEAINTASSIVKSNPSLSERMRDIVTYQHDRLRAAIDLQDLELEFKAGGSKGKAKYDKEKEELQRKYDDAVDGVETLMAETSYYV